MGFLGQALKEQLSYYGLRDPQGLVRSGNLAWRLKGTGWLRELMRTRETCLLDTVLNLT